MKSNKRDLKQVEKEIKEKEDLILDLRAKANLEKLKEIPKASCDYCKSPLNAKGRHDDIISCNYCYRWNIIKNLEYLKISNEILLEKTKLVNLRNKRAKLNQRKRGFL